MLLVHCFCIGFRCTDAKLRAIACQTTPLGVGLDCSLDAFMIGIGKPDHSVIGGGLSAIFRSWPNVDSMLSIQSQQRPNVSGGYAQCHQKSKMCPSLESCRRSKGSCCNMSFTGCLENSFRSPSHSSLKTNMRTTMLAVSSTLFSLVPCCLITHNGHRRVRFRDMQVEVGDPSDKQDTHSVINKMPWL